MHLPGVGTNRYAYSDNDPINKSDPSGHVVIPVAAALAVTGLVAIAVSPYGQQAARQAAEATQKAVDAITAMASKPNSQTAPIATTAPTSTQTESNKAQQGIIVNVYARPGWTAEQVAEAKAYAAQANVLAQQAMQMGQPFVRGPVPKSIRREADQQALQARVSKPSTFQGKVVGHVPDTTFVGVAPRAFAPMDAIVNSSLGRQAQNTPYGTVASGFAFAGVQGTVSDPEGDSSPSPSGGQ
jgi:hypothetical protein